MRQIVIFLSIVGSIAVNVLATTLPLNGQTTQALSARFPVLVTPPGYVFSIWSVIYLGLIAYAIYQLLPAQRDSDELRRIAPWVLVGCAANAAWIVLWHYNQVLLTVPVMLTLLASLIAIFAVRDATPATWARRWLVHTPFDIYMGWISVATIVNISVALYNLGWNDLGAAAPWAIGVLAVGAALGVIIGGWRSAAYGLAIIWAYNGIATRPDVVGSAALWMAGLVFIACVGGSLWLARRGRSALHAPGSLSPDTRR